MSPAVAGRIGFCGQVNTYRRPAFVVLEIPSPISGVIQAIRDSSATSAARLPVEISVAGSSGVGPIPVGTDKGETEECLKVSLEGFAPFQNRSTGGSSAADSTPGLKRAPLRGLRVAAKRVVGDVLAILLSRNRMG